MSSPAADKGKDRAPEVDERTPLLVQEDSGSQDALSLDLASQSNTHAWNRPILTVALLSLTVFFVTAFLFIITSGYHYASWVAHVNPDQLVRQGVVVKYPSNVEVLEVTHDAVVVQVDGAAGIDADWILGLENMGDQGLLGPARRWFGRWLADRVDRVTITIADVKLYAPYSRTQHQIPHEPLLTLSTPPITIPLTTRRRTDFGVENESWLTPLTIPFVLTPNPNGTVLMDFVSDALNMRRLLVRAEADWIRVVGGSGKQWWNPWSLFEVKRKNIEQILRYEMPSNKPKGPSDSDPIGSLVTLRSYSIHQSPSSSLGVSAEADILSPFPSSLHGIINHPLAFTVALLADSRVPAYDKNSTTKPTPEFVSVAEVMTGPISLTRPNISLSLSGTILPLPQEAMPLLSAFLSNFLSARPSPIMITSPAPLSVSVRTTFPAPKEKPKIIKSISLQNMRLYPDPDTGEALLAAATIIASIELPPGTENLKLDVGRLLPDVLVFDGPPPKPTPLSPSHLPTSPSTSASPAAFANIQGSGGGEPFPAPPLPTPLPANAFARIRPRAWLNATSILQPDPVDPIRNLTVVTAFMEDVPLDVLPQRDAVLRAFIQKVIFKGSALAGVRGDAAVGLSIDGLAMTNGSDMELRGLPVEGEFRIVRGGMVKLEGVPVLWS